jgi:hypothetical protein
MEENFEEQNKLPELKLGKDFFFRKKKKKKNKNKNLALAQNISIFAISCLI